MDLDEVAEATSMKFDAVSHEFGSKGLLCESWMERTDERTKSHHEKMLSSGKSMREVLDLNFGELENFMDCDDFVGCPFTNTALAVRGKCQPATEQRVKEHKTEIRRFFLELCSRTSFHPEIVGEALSWSIPVPPPKRQISRA